MFQRPVVSLCFVPSLEVLITQWQGLTVAIAEGGPRGRWEGAGGDGGASWVLQLLTADHTTGTAPG